MKYSLLGFAHHYVLYAGLAQIILNLSNLFRDHSDNNVMLYMVIQTAVNAQIATVVISHRRQRIFRFFISNCFVDVLVA